MLLCFFLFSPFAAAAPTETFLYPSLNTVLVDEKALEAPKQPFRTIVRQETYFAHVTAYNTVEAQTDTTPCIAAGGPICGRKDVVACPRHIPLHTWVSIEGKEYECMDRTAPKYDHRFDISCDKDMACPSSLTGRKEVTVMY